MLRKNEIKENTSLIPRKKPLLIVPQKKRPLNPLNKWIKEMKNSYQITRKDICYIYRNIIFTKTFGELKEIMDNEEKRDKYPALVIAVVAGVLGDIARGNIINLTRMIQFVFPDAMKGFDPEEFNSKAGQGGYDEIKEIEDALRRLEGDDGLLIIDKLLMAQDTEYKVKNDSE
jgi:hypothetical protein